MILPSGKLFTRLQDIVKENTAQLLLMMALAIVTYWEVTTHSLLINWDDHAYVSNNYAIRELSLENLEIAFTGYFVGNYAPVQIISYMLDYSLWGLKPFGYLTANIFYHCLSAGFLYFLLIRSGFWKWGAFLGAAVFLVHPVQVESVAWVSQRKNLLAMLFYLLSFHAYLSYREKDDTSDRWSYYIWSVVSFSLAILSKSVVVIFPVMLVWHDLLVSPVRRCRRAYVDKIPYAAVAAVFAVIAMISQEGGNGGGRIPYPADAWVVLPLTMITVLARYLQMLLWPTPSLLSIMYFPPIRHEIDYIVAVSLCILIILIGCGVYLYRNNRTCLFWYALFFLGLLPVSQIVPLATMMNDRYLYFPMLGVSGLLAYLSSFLRDRVEGRLLPRILPVAVAVILSCLAAASYQRGKVWRNSISLFSDAVAKYPGQTNTWSRLAEGYVASGDLAMAQRYYENAAKFGELDADARHNLSRVYLFAKEYDKAYQQIWWLLLRGDQSKINLVLLGEYYYRIGSYSEAEKYLTSYLEEYPGNPHALHLLGMVYFMTGNRSQARECLYLGAAGESAAAELFYSIACLEAGDGNQEQSRTALSKAFEKKLTSRNMHEDEACLAVIKKNPLLRDMVVRQFGE